MKVTILGSGTVDPQPHRSCSGYFVETSAGVILMDLGSGALRQAVRSGLPVAATDTLFISHLHPDHTADLVPFLFARNHAPAPWKEAPDLTLHGPPGTGDLLRLLYRAWPATEPKEGATPVRVEEFSEEGGVVFTSGEVEVTAVRVKHGDMATYGFRLRDGEKVLAYSADTALCEGVKRLARGADLFICECSCFPRGREPVGCRESHLSWEDVAEICGESEPAELVLTHLYETVLAEEPNPLQSLRETLSIPVRLAEDGAAISL